MAKPYNPTKREFISWFVGIILAICAFVYLDATKDPIGFFLILVLANIVGLIHFYYLTRSYSDNNEN